MEIAEGTYAAWRTARRCAAVALIAVLSLNVAAAAARGDERANAGVALTGVNLAGPEFNAGRTPGRPFFDYVYPNEREVAYFAGKGANVIRLPVLWERLQPKLTGPLDRGELDRLRATIGLAKRSDLSLVIDIHNFGGYRGQKVGSKDVPVDAFADLWSRLAVEFPSTDRIIFGLMNEPIAMDGPTLRAAANAAIAAIRAAGAQNLVLVPGVGWSGAHDFVPSSGTALLDIRDPSQNFAYEAHQYLDADNSGTHWICVDAKAARERLTAMTAWLRLHKRQGFLGEFGAASDPACLESLDGLLTYMSENSDVWRGWTYWAAGAWWGDYPMSVEQKGGADRPQMDVLARHFARAYSGHE